jgi:inorganic pyrophosphatase
MANMAQYYLTDDNDKKISFWNDIPIGLEKDYVNCCIEIPKEDKAKLQVEKEEKYHPFMQDTRINKATNQIELRYYAQYPLFNYGFIPQTW